MFRGPGRRMVRRRAVGRAVVGTAVVVGTAGAVRHHQDQKYASQDAAAQQQADMAAMQQEQAYQQAQLDQMQQPAPAPVATAPAPAGGSDLTTQLNQLAQLHAAGVLSDAEFATAKQKVLAGG